MEWCTICFYKHKLLGYLSYSIDRDSNRAYAVGIMSFEDKNPVFGRDVLRMFENMFNNRGMRKANFAALCGNPIEKTYDRLVKKLSGRIVGIEKEHCRISDGSYCDIKTYEIMKEDYEKYLNGRPVHE